MIVAQVFLEAMEGCHLFLSPFFVMQTAIFRVSPSAVVQVSVSSGCKDGVPLISSAVIGVPSGLGSSVSFHSPQRAFALALQCCSFSSCSEPELLFLAGFTSSFGSCRRSRSALKRSSLSLELSLDRLTAPRLRGALSSARWIRWTARKLPVFVYL